MLRLISTLMAIIGMLMAGCASQRPAGLRGFMWSYMQDPEEGAKLAYGLPSSDDVAIMFTCRPGSGQVRLDTPGAGSGLILASQGSTARLDTTSVEGGLGGAPLMAADVPAADKTLVRFADTGRLQLITGGHSAPLDATGADKDQVKQFFAACRQKT